MSREREPWARQTASEGGRGLLLFLALLAVLAVIGIGVWGFKVATSEVKGRGDAVRITNDGRNQVNSQEWFEGQFGQIKAADKKLDLAAAEKAAKPNDDFAATNYNGLRNFCDDLVQQYNAEANKVSRGKWRSATLPAQIDTNDTTTDCLETPK